jgi:hypothetical protein
MTGIIGNDGLRASLIEYRDSLIIPAFQLITLGNGVPLLGLAFQFLHLLPELLAECRLVLCEFHRWIGVNRILVSEHDGLAFLGMTGKGYNE